MGSAEPFPSLPSHPSSRYSAPAIALIVPASCFPLSHSCRSAVLSVNLTIFLLCPGPACGSSSHTERKPPRPLRPSSGPVFTFRLRSLPFGHAGRPLGKCLLLSGAFPDWLFRMPFPHRSQAPHSNLGTPGKLWQTLGCRVCPLGLRGSRAIRCLAHGCSQHLVHSRQAVNVCSVNASRLSFPSLCLSFLLRKMEEQACYGASLRAGGMARGPSRAA